MHWHTLTLKRTSDKLKSSPQGLDKQEAATRLKTYGYNVLQRQKKQPLWIKFLKQFKDFMILILLAAAIVSGLMGDLTDTIIILVIVLLNATIGFVQEYRAEKAVEALRSMAALTAKVTRQGAPVELPAKELVPGDWVLLEAGQIVPADIRLFETHGLRIQEASLTGESEDAEKQSTALEEPDLSPGDRRNICFKGTFISAGRGSGMVVETGMHTEMGKIAELLSGEDQTTPLQKRMTEFGKKLSLIVLGICAIIFVTGYLRGEEPLRLLLTTISLAVAAIPEALPAVITISLAFGAKRLVKRQALIRKLPAVETLGSVTYICTDKTGTLTENKMRVDKQLLFPGGDPEEKQHLLLLNLALNNDILKDAEGEASGDSTELALYDFAVQKEYLKSELEADYPRVAEAPFDAERKRMSTLHRYKDSYLLLVKGALEVILEHAELPETPEAKQWLAGADALAGEGYRVLAYAYRRLPDWTSGTAPESLEKELILLGATGLIDPPRPEAAIAIADCYSAGIQPVMITGDHPETARSIAQKIGLLKAEEAHSKNAVVTGKALTQMGKEAFLDRVEKIRVYARVSPAQKLEILQGLQKRGHFAAMTGDGVNDAPALKQANIGIAMGITGTDVSKQAAHMILLDDNFATIIGAVREGRRIFDNIRKFIRYTLTSNAGEIWTLFLAPLVGLPIPLLPVHILWINLVTDGLPGLALSNEPAEKEVMQRPPRDPKESVFAGGLGIQVLWVGLLLGAVCLLTQAWAIYTHNPRWQTMVFNVLCLSQMGQVLAIRSEKQSFFSKGMLQNKPLIGAVLLTLILQVLVTYLPVLQPIFRTEALTLTEFLAVGAVSTVVFFAVEAEKWVYRRRREGKKKGLE